VMNIDAEAFFDARESFDNNTVVEVRVENIVDGNTCSYFRTSSRLLPFARRAAWSAKAGLATLKYIATHELTGVLQPIIGDPKRSLYAPKRQIQKCLTLLVLMGMMCVTAGVTSVGHRTYIEATSTASTIVTPLYLHYYVGHHQLSILLV
jgi:hypothetical protein